MNGISRHPAFAKTLRCSTIPPSTALAACRLYQINFPEPEKNEPARGHRHASQIRHGVLPLCRRMFLRTAIFGGNAKRKQEGKATDGRSGEPEQWRTVFDRKLGETFLAQFGDALVKLGYEKDYSWLDSLPAHRPELDAAVA